MGERRCSDSFGQYQHSLDAKGRLILPREISRRVRTWRPTSAPILKGASPCGRRGSSRARADERLEQSRAGGSVERQQVRYWAANSSDVEFDKAGRFALPTAIREYGQLSGDVLIVGTLDHIELWNPPIYAEKVNRPKSF